ncbi:MAG: glycosyltransferase family 2 protein [Pseudomonadota bacterium]|nr:glycosyltransferase family 2 protein [Pseudomonadota bacterium]
MRVSIIVTTYNRPDALALVLKGLAQQRDYDFEVMIADDGSTESTADILAATQWPFTLKHVWQADDGFRAAKIRNRAVALARGNYLIFLDGDCVPGPDFVRHHQRLAEHGWFVAGNRVLLSEQLTQKLVENPDALFQMTLWDWCKARLQGGINRMLPLLPLPIVSRKSKSKEWRGVKTCNLAMWRKDFEQAQGFDERYVGWGYEDSDLVMRLLGAGVQRKQGRSLVPVLHLWHPENTREHLDENWQRLLATQQNQGT